MTKKAVDNFHITVSPHAAWVHSYAKRPACGLCCGKDKPMTADATIAECLTHLRHQYGGDAPSYPMFYRAIVEGRIPAEKMGRGWLVRREDMDRVRREFGLPARVRPA